MDWHAWIKQHIPFTSIVRGGAAVWPAGASALIDDSLGPILHIHDDASEIFFFIKGRCRLEIGDTEEFFEAGDFVLIPPLTPHNLWNAGDGDLLVFWAVAPNFVNNKWRIDNFPPGAMDLRGIRSHVSPGVVLPGDQYIQSTLLAIAEQGHSGVTAKTQEAIIYAVQGRIEVKVGKLAGTLETNEFVHVPVETAYSITARPGETASAILFQMPGA